MYADQTFYSDEQAQQLMYECITVQTLLEKYAQVWANQDLEIIESEQVFELPIINPDTDTAIRVFRQTGKKDRQNLQGSPMAGLP